MKRIELMVKIHKIGNSFKVTIPPALLKALNWNIDTEVDLKTDGKSIIITPKEKE
jgi:antitoxin component of MazEF toxin-antitoxin module